MLEYIGLNVWSTVHIFEYSSDSDQNTNHSILVSPEVDFRCGMTVSEKVSRRNRHQERSPLEGLRWTNTITQKIAVIRNAIYTLSLLFVAAENGAVDVCRYLLAR